MYILGGLLANRQKKYDDIPIGREGKRYEIANCVVFLATNAGSLVTGHTLVADGGSWLTSANSMVDGMNKFKEVQAKSKM